MAGSDPEPRNAPVEGTPRHARSAADALYARLRDCVDAEARRLAQLMASKDDAHLLGDTEFQVRDRVHDLGSHVLQLALDERQKGATKGRA